MKMTQQVVFQSAVVNRKEPLLLAKAMGMKDDKRMMMMNRDIRNRDRIGELAGGTAAECAAVCCCCPCAVVHLIVLAVYKVPTGLCKKALRKNKRQQLLRKKKKKSSSLEKNQHQHQGITMAQQKKKNEMITSDDDDEDELDGDDALDLDSQMWDHFYGAGFWRSSSQKED